MNRFIIEKLCVALNLAKLEDKEISKLLAEMGTKQQAELRKMIRIVREYNCNNTHQSRLHSLYRKVSYKC